MNFEYNTTTLNDLKKLTRAYSGNENPSIWVMNDENDNTEDAIVPSCVFIDDDGDIIIQINKKLL